MEEQKRPEDYSVTELQAIGYQKQKTIALEQQQLQIIEMELQRRNGIPTSVDPNPPKPEPQKTE